MADNNNNQIFTPIFTNASLTKFIKKNRGNNELKDGLKKFKLFKSKVPPQTLGRDFPLSPPFNRKILHCEITRDLRMVYFVRGGAIYMLTILNHDETMGAASTDIAKKLEQWMMSEDPNFWSLFKK